MNIISSAKINEAIQKQMMQKHPEITFHFCENIVEAEQFLPQVDVLLTYGTDVSEEHLQKAPNLKWIMVMSAGVEQLPIEEILKRDIFVTNSRGIHAIPMAEYTIAMMLHVARQTPKLMQNQSKRVWERLRMEEIYGKTIGIVGTGAIGEEIARLAKAFQMKTLGYNRTGRSVHHFDEIYHGEQLEIMLNQADFIVSVLPGTKSTENLFGETQFKAMKDSAVFINIGRGLSINEHDLVKALQTKTIQHAVLDVFKNEPLAKDSPFWELDNVTITPHLSGVSPAYQQRVFEIFEHNLQVFMGETGQYINKVNMRKGY